MGPEMSISLILIREKTLTQNTDVRKRVGMDLKMKGTIVIRELVEYQMRSLNKVLRASLFYLYRFHGQRSEPLRGNFKQIFKIIF